jgi:hypothetical protein
VARPAETDAATQRVLAELERRGLLLQAGREFPSIANLIAGDEIKGSWWTHPKSNLIYWVCQDLEDHPRVAEARLLAGKVTHLWQSVWPDVAAVALARMPWQFEGLSAAARGLLEGVDHEPVRTDAIAWNSPEKLGDVCRLLERRLLVKSLELHTSSGKHAKQLMSWEAWWKQCGSGAVPSVAAARAHLESLVGDATHLLPWHVRSRGLRTR